LNLKEDWPTTMLLGWGISAMSLSVKVGLGLQLIIAQAKVKISKWNNTLFIGRFISFPSL
jgi:hypothetical protein